MAKSEIVLKCEVTAIRVLFFPFAVWTRVGDNEKLTICCVPVYENRGGNKKLMWSLWREYWK